MHAINGPFEGFMFNCLKRASLLASLFFTTVSIKVALVG